MSTYSLIFLLLGIFLNIFPAMLWMAFYLRKDSTEEPHNLIFWAFIAGGAATLPFFLLRSLSGWIPQIGWHALFGSSLVSIIISLFWAAFLEEMCKHIGALAVMKRSKECTNDLSDGVIYAVVAALGFSFVENIFYSWLCFQQYGLGKDLLELYVVRNAVTMFGHTFFSGVFGFLYARAYIAPNPLVITSSAISLGIWDLIKRIRPRNFIFAVTRAQIRTLKGPEALKGWKGANARELVIEGALAAVLFHGIYNVLLTVPINGHVYSFLVLPFLVFGGYLVSWLLTRR
ncbi:MAG: PrsW family glutamic-type intramembrane protease [Candidatus Gracilibacteria bacterium]